MEKGKSTEQINVESTSASEESSGTPPVSKKTKAASSKRKVSPEMAQPCPTRPLDELAALRDGLYSMSISELRRLVWVWRGKVSKTNPLTAAYDGRLFWFLCPQVHNCPELIEAVARYYNPHTRQVCNWERKPLFSINAESIEAAFAPGYPPSAKSRGRNVNLREMEDRYSDVPSLRSFLNSHLNRPLKEGEWRREGWKLRDFKNNYMYIMLAWVLGCGKDEDVLPYQITIAERIQQEAPVMFNWAGYLAQAIHISFLQIQTRTEQDSMVFRFCSHFAWLFLFHLHSKIKSVRVEDRDNDGSPLPVYQWTRVLCLEESYYRFNKFFLGRALTLVEGVCPRVPRILNKHFTEGNKPFGDTFRLTQGLVLRTYGFTGKPFLLPYYATSYLFSLEAARQMDYTETVFGQGKKKGYMFSYPFQWGPVTVLDLAHHYYLHAMLKSFKLVELPQNWKYDPLGLIQHTRKGRVTPFHSCPNDDIMAERNNPSGEDLEWHIEEMQSSPPWHDFYEVEAEFDPVHNDQHRPDSKVFRSW